MYVGSRTVRLDPDKDVAWQLRHELMAKPPEARAIAPAAELTTAEILDRFLDWYQKNRAAKTYEANKYYSQALVDGLPVSGLKPFHLTAAMDAQAGWGNNTKHNFVMAVNRAWKQEIIDRNPVAHTEKPAREARVIEARHLDFSNNRVVFPPKESKGKKKHRVVYLTPEAADILRPLATLHPVGPVFLNSEGTPWTKDSINSSFCRLKKKLGRKLHMGAFRKGFATEGLKSGVDVNTMAHLMGHTNGVMLAKVYARAQADPTFTAEAAIRAKKPRGS